MKITLITGATGGLGKEFAKLYAKDGNHLLLVGTNSEKLELLKDELKKQFDVQIDCYCADLSNRNQQAELFEYTKQKGYFVNNLVNNAGFGDRTDFKDMDVEKQMTMLDVNCSAVLYFTRVFLDDMLKNDEGHIINVASIAGLLPGPYMSTYHASKAFVLSLGEAVAYEIRKTNVKLLTLCPGPFISGFVSRAKFEYTFSKLKPITAEKVATYGYKKSKKGASLAVVGFREKVLTFLPRLFPRKMATAISASTAKKGG